MPIHKREIYLTKVFGKEPYWPFHFPEKNVIYDFYGSKQLEQVSKAEPTMGTNYFRSSNFFLCNCALRRPYCEIQKQYDSKKFNLWIVVFESTIGWFWLTLDIISKGCKSYNVSFSSVFIQCLLDAKVSQIHGCLFVGFKG